MKNSKNVIFIVVGIILTFIILGFILNGIERNISKEEKVVKGMSETTQIVELQSQLANLEKEKEEYATKVQNYKASIAQAITSAGVSTSADASTSTMTTNIGKILSSSTAGTATAGDILSGKTAWLNGTKITGTMANRGSLNWSPTTSTTYSVPAGYYSGGTLDSSGAYNAGYDIGVAAGKENAQLNIAIVATGVTSYNNTYTISGKTLTSDNFYFVPTSVYAQPMYVGSYASGVYSCTIKPSLTYTNNTLKLSGCTGSKYSDPSHDTGIQSLKVTGNIYCIY